MRISQSTIDKIRKEQLSEPKTIENIYGSYEMGDNISLEPLHILYFSKKNGKLKMIFGDEAKKEINEILKIWVSKECTKHDAYRHWKECFENKQIDL